MCVSEREKMGASFLEGVVISCGTKKSEEKLVVAVSGCNHHDVKRAETTAPLEQPE